MICRRVSHDACLRINSTIEPAVAASASEAGNADESAGLVLCEEENIENVTNVLTL